MYNRLWDYICHTNYGYQVDKDTIQHSNHPFLRFRDLGITYKDGYYVIGNIQVGTVAEIHKHKVVVLREHPSLPLNKYRPTTVTIAGNEWIYQNLPKTNVCELPITFYMDGTYESHTKAKVRKYDRRAAKVFREFLDQVSAMAKAEMLINAIPARYRYNFKGNVGVAVRKPIDYMNPKRGYEDLKNNLSHLTVESRLTALSVINQLTKSNLQIAYQTNGIVTYE